MPPFVAMGRAMLEHRAYINLTYSAAKALPYFMKKPKLPFNWNAFYEVEFALTYSEAKKLGFSTGTWRRIIGELVKKGFIDPVRKGGLCGEGRISNIFKNSRRWEKYGTQKFEKVEWKEFI